MNNENISSKKSQLGYVLKLLRIANNMSIKELSQKINVSSNYISEIESSKKSPSLETLAKYSEALNVSKSTILYFDEQGEKEGYNYQTLLLKILEEIVRGNK